MWKWSRRGPLPNHWAISASQRQSQAHYSTSKRWSKGVDAATICTRVKHHFDTLSSRTTIPQPTFLRGSILPASSSSSSSSIINTTTPTTGRTTVKRGNAANARKTFERALVCTMPRRHIFGGKIRQTWVKADFSLHSLVYQLCIRIKGKGRLKERSGKELHFSQLDPKTYVHEVCLATTITEISSDNCFNTRGKKELVIFIAVSFLLHEDSNVLISHSLKTAHRLHHLLPWLNHPYQPHRHCQTRLKDGPSVRHQNSSGIWLVHMLSCATMSSQRQNPDYIGYLLGYWAVLGCFDSLRSVGSVCPTTNK